MWHGYKLENKKKNQQILTEGPIGKKEREIENKK